MSSSSTNASEKENRLNQLYLAIISRDKEYIEEKEGLSVAELPTLVMPSNTKVKEKVDEIKSGFLNYSYDKDFKEASNRAYEFVKKNIGDVTLPLQFWLTPDETITFMLGDIMDKNILLCSILIGLGNPSTKVFVKMEEDGSRKVFVHYEFKERLCVLDEKGSKEFSHKEEMLKSLHLGEETVAYEFNNQMYADIY